MTYPCRQRNAVDNIQHGRGSATPLPRFSYEDSMTPAIAPIRPPFALAPKAPEIKHVSAMMLKPAEGVTLRSLKDECFGVVYPLLSTIRVPRRSSYVNDAGFKKIIEPPTLEEHLTSQCELLKAVFAPSLFDYGVSRAMLDVSHLDAQQNQSTLAMIESKLSAEKHDIIPVIRVGQMPAHAFTARRWNKSYGTGLALRVIRRARTRKGLPQGWPDVGAVLATLNDCGGKPEETDLVLDAGHVADSATVKRNLDELITLMATLVTPRAWRSVTVLSGAFPPTIGTLELDTYHRLKRWDFILWKRLRHILRDRQVACPIYGDYGMVFPIPANGGTLPLANLRYTDEHEFVVMRREEEPAMRAVCKAICAEDWYRGSDFSYGDEWIDRVARNLDGPGNGETWNRTGLQHHVVFVVRQLSGLT
jgi:hypothetical protein